MGATNPQLFIGQPVGGGTSASVPFVDSSVNLAQDNANFNYDAPNNGLRLLSTAPASGTSRTFLVGGVTTAIGIGGASIGAAITELGGTFNNTAALSIGFFQSTTFNGTANSPIGVLISPTFAPGTSISTVNGFFGIAIAAPPTGVAITSYRGFIARIDYANTAGTVTTGQTFTVLTPQFGGTLKPSTQYGVLIQNQGATNIGTSIALQVDAQSGGTTSYAAIFAGGNVGIGNSAPTDVLQVTGNISLDTAGNKLKIKTGSNATLGAGTLASGVGTISTTAVTANSAVFLTDTSNSIVNLGALTVATINAGTNFVVKSSNTLDTATFNWLIIN